jgi:hypothetical protein
MAPVYIHMLCLGLAMLQMRVVADTGLHSQGTMQREMYHSQADTIEDPVQSSLVHALMDAVVPRPWVGLHNNLEQLAAVRSAANTITFTIYTSIGYLGMLKNWLYAITT